MGALASRPCLSVLALVGIVIGLSAFQKNPLRKMPKILEEKWRIDEVYNGYIVDPDHQFLARRIVERLRSRLYRRHRQWHRRADVSNSVLLLRGIQVGFVRSYAAFILFGALIVWYFIYYGLILVYYGIQRLIGLTMNKWIS